MADERKWERIAETVDSEIGPDYMQKTKYVEVTERMAVPGGWLYRTLVMLDYAQVGVSVCFVPTPSN